MKLFFTLVFFLGFSSFVNAHTTAKLDQVLLYEAGNILYIYPTGGVTNPPGCHGQNGDYISYDMSRPRASEFLSMLLAALVAQKTVFLATTGKCTDQAFSETLSYISIRK